MTSSIKVYTVVLVVAAIFQLLLTGAQIWEQRRDALLERLGRDFAGFPSGAAAFFRSRRKSPRFGIGISAPFGVFCLSLIG